MGEFDRSAPADHAEHRRDGHHAVRLGLTSVQGIGTADAERIVAARAERPFDDMADVVRRCGLSRAQQEQLATAGAFDEFGLTRRQAIWNAGYTDGQDKLPGTAIVLEPAARNTAPAMTLAALHALALGGDPVLVVTPADQTVTDAEAFGTAVLSAVRTAAGGSIVLLGITPDRPETGFGYIRAVATNGDDGVLRVERFVEEGGIERQGDQRVDVERRQGAAEGGQVGERRQRGVILPERVGGSEHRGTPGERS